MSYSKKEISYDNVYGRKIIREKKRKRRRILLPLLIAGVLLAGILIGILIPKEKNYYGKNNHSVVYKEFLNPTKIYDPLKVSLDDELQEYIYDMSESYEIDYTLVMAVIQQESNFDVNAKSRTDDYGLMQINKANHKWLASELGIKDFMDPKENVRAGLFILRGLFDRYDDTHKVLMAYNMGEYGAKRMWEKGITQNHYSIKIVNAQNKFKEELG